MATTGRKPGVVTPTKQSGEATIKGSPLPMSQKPPYK
jgi:hypothetical protein